MKKSAEDVDRWSRVESLFTDALGVPMGLRRGWLDAACGGDRDLRRDVGALLDANDANGMLDDVMGRLHGASDGNERFLEAGQRDGPYRVVRELGRGGMGAVYLAVREEGDFRQRVAVELVRTELDSDELRRRFLKERRILARLEHPGIARLVDGGLTDTGVPFFAMEYIEGTEVREYCNAHRLSVTQRIELVCATCDAVQYAHQNLVVHRDLKPGNILVTGRGAVKLLDFGVAKLLAEDASASEVATRTGRWITPEYASPEQVRGDAVTTASDVYALGVLLYELLTGHRPYGKETGDPIELGRLICEEDPRRPSTAVSRTMDRATPDSTTISVTPSEVSRARNTSPERLRRALSGDLDTIVLKALEKYPDRRYATVGRLAEDLRRHITGQPVRARPQTVRYRVAKFTRRHKVGVGATALLTLALLTGATTTLWQAREAAAQAALAEEERDRARREADKAARVTALMVDMFRLSDPSEALGETVTARQVLELGAVRIETELGAEPEIQAQMYDEIGRVYHNLGLYPDAERFYDRSHHTKVGVYGQGSVEVAGTLYLLGALNQDWGRYEDAEANYRNALAIQRERLEPDAPELAATLHDLGWLLSTLNRAVEAEEALEESLAIRRKALDPTDPELASTLYALATAQHEQGDFAASTDLFRESVEIYRQVPGGPHPLAATALFNLATVLQFQGQLAEAEPLIREALDMRRMLFEAGHPEISESVYQLAALLNDWSRYEEAAPLFEEAIDAWGNNPGPDHPFLATARLGRGANLRALGAYGQGIQLLVEVVAGQRRALGEDHPTVAFALLHLGGALYDAGRLGEATTRLAEAEALSRRVLGEQHPYVVSALGGLGRVDQAAGNLVRARDRYASAIEIGTAALGEDHRYVVDATHSLATLSHERGELEDAERLYRSAINRRRARDADGIVAIVPSLIGLGSLLTERGEPDDATEAEALLREALGLLERALPDDHWRIARAWSELGACLAAFGLEGDAEALLLAGYELIADTRGAQHPAAATASRRLFEYYVRVGRPDDAARFWRAGAEGA